MRLRPAIAITALTLLALSGCGLLPPAPPPVPTPTGTAEETPTPTPTPVAKPLPKDAVLGITMRATTDTGAALDIQLVLLKPVSYSDPAGAPRAAATIAWCEGEVDQSVVESQSGFSFAELDATATPVPGTSPWPSDLPLHLSPGEGDGPTLAEGGDVYPVERPNELNDPGFYVPHCQQDGFMTVPGHGALYLGFQDDATTLSAWVNTTYGATFDAWGEPTGPVYVTLSDCAAVITPLGKSMGASESNMVDFFSETQCFVQGSTV